ncbi:hypothetical protein VNI00_008765 [Paramarasmius palmivorus]|uniref:acylaminoacyl-peptidase n=1 Tax=Paramarasmius palmivorus TaxID=297713 RepID=A0AAW0CYY3_9AGAR
MARTYDLLAQLPIPTSASFVDKDVIQLNSLARDHTRNAKRTLSKTIFITPNSSTSSPNQEINEIVHSSVSESRKYRAILRETGSGEKKKRFVEIWDKERVVVCKDVTDIHGSFYNDGERLISFGDSELCSDLRWILIDQLSSLSFSPAENTILYVAEEKFTQSKDTPAHYLYKQSFGEGLPDKKRPAIFLFKWDVEHDKTSLVHVITNTPDVLFGQPIFTDKESVLFATGYEHTFGGRLLGIKGCFNRPSGIWRLTLDVNGLKDAVEKAEKEAIDVETKVFKLTPPKSSCRSPRVFQAGDSPRLFWLACPTGGAHWATTRLQSVGLAEAIGDGFSESSIKSVVDIVDAPSSPGGFPGFYPDPTFPSSPIIRLDSGEHLAVHSVWGSRSTILLISLDDGTVKNLTPIEDELPYSWSVLCTDNSKRVVCARSSNTVPFEIVLGEFDGEGNVSWKVLQESLSLLPASVQEGLRALKVDIIPIPDRHPTESILVQHPKEGKTQIPPHIVIPHGGPHATSFARFETTIATLALEGYNLSIPNYTGSLGFGETHVRALLGNCGTLDVGDCIASTRHMVKLGVAEEAPSKLFVFGGSHGGFLSGHLIGQYPDTFTAASLRNPVMSCGELSTSDIRDWYWAEFGRDYPILSSEVGSDGRSIPQVDSIGLMTPDLYGTLFKASPIAHVEKVKAAVLLCIGGSDRRVAPTQGIDYYHALKAARAKQGGKHARSGEDDGVEMLWFQDDGHPLDGVEATRITFLRTAEWFRSRLQEY